MISRTDRQKEGIKKWIQAGCKGTLCYFPGFGKTRCALLAINKVIRAKSDAKILVSVPTDVLKEQWLESINKYGFQNNVQVQIINTVVKHEWDVDLLIQDECHICPTVTFSEVFNCVHYNMILCLTGTLERLDGKEVLVKAYAPVVDKITREEGMLYGWTSPAKEYVVMLDVDLSEYNKWNQEFIGFFSQMGYDFDLGMILTTNIIERRKYAKKLGLDQKQFDAVCFGWMDRLRKRKMFVQSHPKKFEIARKILDARKDKKCITFSATIKDSEKLATKNEYVLHSKKSKKQNDTILEEFNSKQTGVLNTSKACDVGVDIKGLSVGIILSTDSSQIRKNQRFGRILRYEPGKIAELFTLVIKGTVEEKWFANSASGNYIVINEQQLEKVLNNEPLEIRERKITKDVKNRY